jgi:hypothetical protein
VVAGGPLSAAPPAGADLRGATEYKVKHKGVLFTVTAPARTVSGDALQVALRLENQGTDTFHLVESDKYADYSIDVRRVVYDQGRPVYQEVRRTQYGTSHKSAYRSTLVPFGPTQAFATRLTPNWLFDLTAPGEYTLSVTRRVYTDAQKRGHFDLVVENIRFRVLEKK